MVSAFPIKRTTKNITLDVNTTLTYLPQVINEIMKPEEFSKGYNAMFAYTESIPKELANELAVETKIFFKKCYEKMEGESENATINIEMLQPGTYILKLEGVAIKLIKN